MVSFLLSAHGLDGGFMNYDAEFQNNVRAIIKHVGEDPGREGLIKTPERCVDAWRFLTSGYKSNVQEIVGDAIFNEKSDGVVLVRDIEMFSLCEHHLLPFHGRAHVAYIPNGKIIGLSKIPRIVEVFSRRLQVQERMTRQIADALVEILNPYGVAVIVEAYHLCMMMRGVEKQCSKTVTSSLSGVFQDNPHTRAELLSLLNRS